MTRMTNSGMTNAIPDVEYLMSIGYWQSYVSSTINS